MLVDIHGKRKKGEETRDSIRAQGDGEEPGVSPFPASAPPTQGPVQCPAMCFVARTLPPFSSNWNETPLEMTNCMRAEAQSCTTEKASSLCVVMQCIQSWSLADKLNQKVPYGNGTSSTVVRNGVDIHSPLKLYFTITISHYHRVFESHIIFLHPQLSPEDVYHRLERSPGP